ncbi:MAG: ribosome hibernation-promoting factor, HPF/YfiA family [Verrucomicrobiales bacterium]
MQTHNVNLPVNITARHMNVTDALRDYVVRKIEGLRLDHPRIIEAKAILDFHQHHHRQLCEIILYCANHITIDASSESVEDLYAAIDETIAKIARRMRKHKTRLQRHARARHNQSIRHFTEHVFETDVLDKHAEEVEPLLIHPEPHKVKPLFPDEAIMELELSDRPFVLFHNQKTDKLCLIYRRKDGDYGMVVPEDNPATNGGVRVA